MKVITRLLALKIILGLSLVSAEAEEMDSLLNLSIEDLLNIKVSTGSTSSETVVSTPAIVSRYNRIDMERMGVTNLREMFNFIPGVIVQDSLPGWASVQIRGVDEAFNQKVLFLLDGVPYHQPSHSLIPMDGIPWESISHVEVIRGPGSVVYGTQASGGVLNVITRTDTDENSAFVKIGTNNLREASAYLNWQLSNDVAIYAAFEYRTQDEYETTYNEIFPDVGAVSDEVSRLLESESGLLRYTSNEFIFQFQAFSSTTIGINDAYTDKNTLQPTILESKGYLAHLENSWNTDKSRITAFIDYNYYTFDLQINNIFAPGSHALATKDNNGKDDYRVRFGGDFVYNINDSLDFSAGLEKETRSNGVYRLYSVDMPNNPLVTFLEKDQVDEFSAFTQLDYKYEEWRVLVGARFTDNEISGQKTTPRTAISYKIDKNQSFKYLHSTGFNSPNPTQTSINAAGNVIGNKSLTAEVVTTQDFAYSYSKDNMLFVANVYYLEAKDFIIRRFDDSVGAVSFFNEGNYTRKGAEIDFQLSRPNSKVFMNLAYQKEGNKVILDDPDAFNTPRLTLSIGANKNVGDKHNFGANVSYIGARNNLDSYSVLNIIYTTQFSDYDFFAVVRNVTDEDILNPSNTAQNSVLVAQGEKGRNFQLGVRVNF